MLNISKINLGMFGLDRMGYVTFTLPCILDVGWVMAM